MTINDPMTINDELASKIQKIERNALLKWKEFANIQKIEVRFRSPVTPSFVILSEPVQIKCA